MLRYKVLVCVLALAVSIPAYAQQSPPEMWTGAAGTEFVPGADHEYGGERAIGDVLAENASSYRRTARLAATYDADIQGEHVSLPAGTLFVATRPLMSVAVAVDTAERQPRREAAPGTIVWCAFPERGWAPCFFWDAEAGVHGQALMSGGAPSTRAWLGRPTPAPPPELLEQDVDLPPNEERLILQEANADGYVLQRVLQEAGVTYTRSYRRQPWNQWDYGFVAPSQRMRLTPILDASGAVRGANVEFTREPPPAAQ
jgi:hypothetical protein